MSYSYTVLVILIAFFTYGDGCTFPTGLQNNHWTSSGFGNMEFLVSEVTFTDDTNVLSTYTCHLNSGNDYVIRSPATSVFTISSHYYYCLQLSQVTTYSYSYYLLSALENDLRRKTFTNTTSVTSTNTVCDISAVVAELYVLVLRDTPNLAATSCADPLLGNFQYRATLSDGTAACGAAPGTGYLGICDSNSTTVIYNQTTCTAKLSYSFSGLLYCIASASTTVGSTQTYYQVLYNSDVNPANPFFQFTCMALSFNSSTTNNSLVFASEIHTKCEENQDSTVAVTGGNLIFFTPNVTCVPLTEAPPVEEASGSSTNIGLIVGLVLAGLLILLLIAALLFYCLYWKNRDPNAGKPIVENTKPRFEDPDKEDIIEDLELEDVRSEPLTREDIVFTAESPNFIPNGHAVVANGHAGENASRRKSKDAGITLTEHPPPNDKQITPRLNRDRESMVIFNGDEKVISGNDSRVVPSEKQTFRRFQPEFGGPEVFRGGPLTLQGLEDDTGDGLGELSPQDLKDETCLSYPREKTNLLPPIETIDPEK